jgi:hypothetical protein
MDDREGRTPRGRRGRAPSRVDAGQSGADLARPALSNGEHYSEKVERSRPGGGEQFHPQSVAQAQTHLLPQARRLADRAADIPEHLRASRVVFFATLLPNYLANTYFPNQLLYHLDLVPLGSRAGRGILRTRGNTRENVVTKTLILAGSDESFVALQSLLSDVELDRTPRQAQEELRRIDQLKLPDVEDVVGAPSPPEAPADIWEAVLHPDVEGSGYGRLAASDETLEKLNALVREEDGELLLRYRREVAGLTFVPLRATRDAVAAISRFNPLRSLRPLPLLRPVPSITRTTVAPPPPLDPATRPMRAKPTAIFDGGVDEGSPYFGPWVSLTDVTSEGADPDDQAHGSAVTSAFLYGHLRRGTPLKAPPSRVDHFRVLPTADATTDPDHYVLLDQIEATLSGGTYDLVNLSLGPQESVEDDAEPSRWTATLDRLAYEKGALFVVAAGNNGESDVATGLNRVQLPGDMVNGLCVGACDVLEPEHPWARAPYSAVGPGRAGGRVQPAGVAFGGLSPRGYRVIVPSGIADGEGTSFAAPHVAGGLAALAARLGSLSDQNSLRAFAIHAAESDDEAPWEEIGHGRLHRTHDVLLNCPEERVTVLFQGTASRDQVDRLYLPYPDSAERRGNVSVRWTLAYTSPTDPAEALEYTEASLDAVFRPHQFVHTATEGGRSRAIHVIAESEEVQRIYERNGSISDNPRSKGRSTTGEAGRRAAGKWETVRHDRVGVRATGLSRPVLDISYLARHQGELLGTAPPLPYAVVVTVEAARGIDLYEQVLAAYPRLMPLRIEVQPRVRV